MKYSLVSRTISRRIPIVGLLAAAFVVSISQAGWTAQTDPLTGAWKLNPAKSTYNPGPAPKSMTITTEAADQELRSTFEGLDAAGMPVRIVFVVTPDGQPHAVTGTAMYDSVTVRRIDPYIRVYTISKTGNVVTRGTMVLSPDGRTTTLHTIGMSFSIPQSDNVAVYEKQ